MKYPYYLTILQETTPGSSGDFNFNNNNINDTAGTIHQPKTDQAKEPNGQANNTNETTSTDLLTLNINTNGSSDISSESTNEQGKTTTNGLPYSPIINGQDITSSFVNIGPDDVFNPAKPDLLGDISNNQKQNLSSSSNDGNDHLLDTQTVHDANRQEEKLMNE